MEQYGAIVCGVLTSWGIEYPVVVSEVWAACGAMPWSRLPRDLRDLRDLRAWPGQGEGWPGVASWFAKDVLIVPRHWFHAALASGLEPATSNIQQLEST